MRYFKLFIISVVVFGVMLWGISLLFPSTTYISRAVNIAGTKSALRSTIPQLLDKAFGADNTFVKKYMHGADTVFFHAQNQPKVQGGMAIYDMGNDSSTIQLFYQISVPWYKPWEKFALMINEEKYGPSLDTAVKRLRR